MTGVQTCALPILSTANVPKFPGLETFKGDWYHTGEWPHDGVNFTGKRVGMIGTGSTGIQAAPVIAAAASHLTVFQRTANYSVPARNAPLTPERKRWFREHYEETRELVRSTANGHGFRISTRSALEASEASLPAIGLVVVARGSGIAAAFRDIGATRVISGGETGKASTGEILNAARAAGREHVFVLPNDKDVLMAAERAAQSSAIAAGDARPHRPRHAHRRRQAPPPAGGRHRQARHGDPHFGFDR